jgi:Lactate racemase N-terminal domain
VKLPILAGSRLAFVGLPDGAEVLRPPAPVEPVTDVGAAVRDALRFPLAGEPLEALVTRAGTATIVVEHPSLPLPSSVQDPRQEALAATADELERLGVPFERQTLLVAGGLEQRARRHELERLVSPEFARRFRGHVVVHDVEDPALRQLESGDGVPLRINPALLESDLVLTVTAAETVLHGGPASLLASAGVQALREAAADSLLEPRSSRGWDVALRLERTLLRRVPLVGVSVALDHPRLGGALRGFPHEEGVAARAVRSPLGRAFRALPDPVRRSVLRSLPLELNASAVYAGRPSVAHAEALLRATEARATPLEGKLDALCIGVPFTTPHLPREPPNPLLAAYHGLGLALRLWRDHFPVVDGGTAILVHHFHRGFSHAQHPYRVFFRAVRDGAEPETVAAAEAAAGADQRAIRSYRSGRTCHPLLPFVDWDSCAPARERLGAVLIAGCRDSTAARRLGFVPTHGVAAALEMAQGRAGRAPRIGFVAAPPYFPLQVRS